MQQDRLARQTALLRLVAERPIGTQHEAARALRGAGFEVVQTTVSRDIAELGLVKARDADGTVRYVAAAGTRSEALSDAVARYVLAAEPAGSLVVLLTPPGYAGALSQAVDDARHPSVAATIAGDNTVFVAVRDGSSPAALCADLLGARERGAA